MYNRIYNIPSVIFLIYEIDVGIIVNKKKKIWKKTISCSFFFLVSKEFLLNFMKTVL